MVDVSFVPYIGRRTDSLSVPARITSRTCHMVNSIKYKVRIKRRTSASLYIANALRQVPVDFVPGAEFR